MNTETKEKIKKHLPIMIFTISAMIASFCALYAYQPWAFLSFASFGTIVLAVFLAFAVNFLIIILVPLSLAVLVLVETYPDPNVFIQIATYIIIAFASGFLAYIASRGEYVLTPNLRHFAFGFIAGLSIGITANIVFHYAHLYEFVWMTWIISLPLGGGMYAILQYDDFLERFGLK
jgi:hypothetical protein